MRRVFQVQARPAAFKRWPAVVVGLGPIGLECAQLVNARSDLFRLTAAVDTASHWKDRPLAEVLGAEVRGRVRSKIPNAPANGAIAFATTTSSLRSAVGLFQELLEKGYHVVSSTEELSYPYLRLPRLATKLDKMALAANRCLVGTGINPGYAMDVWPLVLASNAQSLRSISVLRVVDASKRRQPLQAKIGSNLSVREFAARAELGSIGHVGLVESAAHVAGGVGWKIDRFLESLQPQVARQPTRSKFFQVARGRVCGIRHRVQGFEGKVKRVDLELQMYLGAKDPRDEVRVTGAPPVHCVVPGGFHGDRTTVSQLIAAASRLDPAQPGLRLASGLASPRFAARPRRISIVKKSG